MPAHEDQKTAEAICEQLAKRGARSWIAPRDIRPAERYPEAIMRAIKQSQYMILVFSSQTNTSQHVSRELDKAASRGLELIPISIEDVKPTDAIDYFVGRYQWVNAVGSQLESQLEAIATNLQSLAKT